MYFIIEVIDVQENKMHLINKIFNNETIRTVWDKDEEKYYISVVDIVGVLSESDNPRDYWYKIKKRASLEEKIELSTICRQLKLKAQDGKYRLTDVTDIEGMFRIIESIPSKNAEPIKQWLARLGKERIDEIFDPSIGINRLIDIYRNKGYDEEWINKRIKNIQDRKTLTNVWQESGINKTSEYALLTDEIYKTWSGMTSREYKNYKGLRKESLRDNMDNIELILTDLGEEATKRLVIKNKPIGLKENIELAKDGGSVAKVAKDKLEQKLGEKIISKNNKLEHNFFDKKGNR